MLYGTTGQRNERRAWSSRIKPLRNTVYPDDLFDQQYRLIQLMHEHGRSSRTTATVCSKPIRQSWARRSSSWTRSPGAWRSAIRPIQSRAGWSKPRPPIAGELWEDSVSQLAAIQRVPVAQAGFLTLPGGPGGFEQEIDRWWRFIDWVDPQGERKLLRQTYDRACWQTPPPTVHEGIVWGDSRLGNMIIGADHRVAAVVDWEQPSLGRRIARPGLVATKRPEPDGGTRDRTALEGMGTREKTIALWSEVSGKSAADIEWYETFACFKMECLAVRMIAIRDMPASVMMAEAGRRTAQLLDVL